MSMSIHMSSIPHTKFGVVGCGPRGIDHVQSTQTLEGAEWVGACDFSAEARATMEEKTGVKAFESFDDLLAPGKGRRRASARS